MSASLNRGRIFKKDNAIASSQWKLPSCVPNNGLLALSTSEFAADTIDVDRIASKIEINFEPEDSIAADEGYCLVPNLIRTTYISISRSILEQSQGHNSQLGYL